MERDENRMQSEQQDEPKFLVTVTLIVNDIGRLVAFYRDVFGATVLREGEPTFLRLGNIWQSRRGSYRRQADGYRLTAATARRPQLVYQSAPGRYGTLLRAVAIAGRQLRDGAESAPLGGSLLQPRPRRLLDRSRSNDVHGNAI